MMERNFDIVVVGAGVVGAAIARELAALDISVGIVDKRCDVTDGTSKANTAILHTGYDASPGTLESQLVAKGYHLTAAFCDATGISYERTGAVLVAWNDEELENLPSLKDKAEKNGYMETYIVDADDVRSMMPNLGPNVRGGLVVPGESIIDAWSVPLGLATDAVNRGATFIRSTEITGVEVREDVTVLHTTTGDVTTRWVVNAAGLGTDVIDQMFGFDRIHNHPRRGELIVYDKLASRLIDRILLPVPSKLGKGVLVSPTIFGNVMLGPTAEDMEDRDDTSTTEKGFEFLLDKGRNLVPELLHEEVTATYAGLRAAHDLKDYLLDVDAGQRYVIAAGIRSTGLTSAMAVAEYVLDLMRNAGFGAATKSELPEPPQMPVLGERFTRPFEDDERICSDSEYGRVMCFCERVTRGEIRDALASTIPPGNLEGLRRRTRAMNGRCQGFFCGANVKELFEEGQVSEK